MIQEDLENTVDTIAKTLAVVIPGSDPEYLDEDEWIDLLFPYLEAVYRSAYLRGFFDASVANRNKTLDICESIDQCAIAQEREVFGASDQEIKDNGLAIIASWDLIPEDLHDWFDERIH